MVKYVLHRSINEHTWEQGIDYKTGSLGRIAETKAWTSEGCELGLDVWIFFTSTPHSVILLDLDNV